MATRFRLPSSGTPPVSPAFQSYTHALGVRRPLVLTDSSALTNVTLTPDAADHLVAGDVSFFQFVSVPLAAQTITATNMWGAIQCFEAHANNNLFLQFWIGVVSNDGNTLLATLVSKTQITAAAELGTGLVAKPYTVVPTAYTITTGDAGARLVVEISLVGTPTATGGVQGHNGTVRVGSDGTGGDTSGGSTATTENPWFQTDQTLSFLTSGTTAKTLDDLTRTAAGTVDSKGSVGLVLGAATVQAAGTVTTVLVVGTLDRTLDGLTSDGDGTVTIVEWLGTLTQTLEALYKDLQADALIQGATARTLDALTATTAGTSDVTGVGTQTFEGLTLATFGYPGPTEVTHWDTPQTRWDNPLYFWDLLEERLGVLSQFLDDLITDLDASAPAGGTLTQTLDGLAVDADGVLFVAGALDRTLADTTLDADAGVLSTIVGTLTRTLADVTRDLRGTVAASGTLTRTLGDVTRIAAGTAPVLTRFGLPSAGSPPVSPAFQTYAHALAVRRPLPLTGTSALTTVAQTPDAADHLVAGDTSFFQGVSDPLNPQTIPAQAVTLTIQALEAHANNDLFVQLWIGVVSQDGLTPLATLLAKTADATEVGTALQSRTMAPTTTAYTITPAQAGARLVVEISLVGTPIATGGVQGHNGSLRFGENGTGPLLPNDTETGTTLNPVLDFPYVLQWFQIGGQLEHVLDAVTCLGIIGTPAIAGSLTQTLGPLQADLDAVAQITGTAAPVLAALTVDADATVTSTGTLTRTLDPLGLFASSAAGSNGILDRTLDAASVTATAASPVTGLTAQTLDAVGLQAIATGAPYVFPAGIPSAEAVGTPGGASTLGVQAIPSAEAVGTLRLHRTLVGLAGIPSEAAVGTPSVVSVLRPAAIPSEEAFGSPHLKQSIVPAGAESLAVVPPPQMVMGAVRIVVAGLASAEIFGSIYLNTGQVATRPPSLPSAEAFGAITQLRRVLHSGSVASAETFGLGGMVRWLRPGAIPTREAFGTLRLGFILHPAGLVSREAFGTIAQLRRILLAGSVGTREAVGLPILSGAVLPSAIPSREAFGVPVLRRSLVPLGIPSREAVGLVALTTRLTPTGVVSAAALGLPRVTRALPLVGIPSREVVTVPLVIPRWVILPLGIPVAENFGVPALLWRLRPFALPSGEAFGLVIVEGGAAANYLYIRLQGADLAMALDAHAIGSLVAILPRPTDVALTAALHSAGPLVTIRLQGTHVILDPIPSVFGVGSS